MNSEYYAAAILAFTMTPRSLAWADVADCLEAFCSRHGLILGDTMTHKPIGRYVTVVQMRSERAFSKERAAEYSRELTDLLACVLPHQARLCRPLSKRGFKAWDSVYTEMATTVELIGRTGAR